MGNSTKSVKRVLIDKAYTQTLTVLAISIAAIMFSLVAINSLYKQHQYQSKVKTAREATKTQLQSNLTEIEALTKKYQSFEQQSPLLYKGRTDTGKNAEAVLDALPSKYDANALATSLGLFGKDYTDLKITVVDDPASIVDSLADPVPIEMPFSMSVTGTAESLYTLLQNLESSIRPIVVENVNLSGTASQLTLDLRAKTYYQPEKIIDSKEEVIK